MSDAERNAERVKSRLMGRLAEIEEQRAVILGQLKEVDVFLAALRAYSNPDVTNPPNLGALGQFKEGARTRNPPREQVLKVVADALIKHGRPMQLRELFGAVTSAGIELHGADPSAVLGTMVWRAKERFTNIKGYGYWLADRPFEPAGYRGRT